MAVEKDDLRPKDMAAILAIAEIEHGEIAVRAGIKVSAISQTLSGKRKHPATVRKVVSGACAMIEEKAVRGLATAA